MTNSKWDYDERQWQIVGKVFYRGFLTACILLVVNGLLQAWGINWANGFYQNFIIMILLHTTISFEAIIRGVYFGKCKLLARWVIICGFGATSLLLWIISIWHFSQGAQLLESSALSRAGFSLALAVMLAITTATAIIVEIKEKRGNSE